MVHTAEFNAIFVVLLALPFISFGQDAAHQESGAIAQHKNFISLKMGADDPWFGASYERLVTRYIGSEFQLGLIGASLGAKFYFPAFGRKRVNFYVGAMPAWGFQGGVKTYFPIGINFLTKKSLRFSLDAGPRVWHSNEEDNFPGFSLKIGKGY